MTNFKFSQQVYEIVKKVPRGKVTTYGEVAQVLGKPRWARQVGWVLHQNRSTDVPCHRVVDRTGRLAPNFAFSANGGPASGGDGAKEQRKRLEVEGVRFADEMHVDLEKYLYLLAERPD